MHYLGAGGEMGLSILKKLPSNSYKPFSLPPTEIQCFIIYKELRAFMTLSQDLD